MANRGVPDFWSLRQSIFRPPKSQKARGTMPDSVTLSPRGHLHERFCFFLMSQCVAKRIPQRGTIPKTVAKLAGRPMAKSSAWEWALNAFLAATPEFAASEYANLIGEARGRIAGLKTQEANHLRKQQLQREAAEARKQHAVERKENGGEATFFDSNKWQRLRYKVLAKSNGRCALCGRSTREHGVILHVDHIKPKSRFPNLALVESNLQVLCDDCNLGKSNSDTVDWRPAHAEGKRVA